MNSHKWTGSSTPYLAPGQGWREEAAAQGSVGSQRVIEVSEGAPPKGVADLLRLSTEDSAVVRRRVIYLDGHPVELADSYWPADIARNTALAGLAKIPGGAVALLSEMGYAPGTVDEWVETRAPTAHECAALKMAAGEWALVLTRLIANDEEHPYEVTVMVTAGPARRLHYSTKVD